MRTIAILTAVRLLDLSYAKPTGLSQQQQVLQAPLEDLANSHHPQPASRQLHGRFLHITGTLHWGIPYLCAMLIRYQTCILTFITKPVPPQKKTMPAIVGRAQRAPTGQKRPIVTVLTAS
jgi:hypothetical protein